MTSLPWYIGGPLIGLMVPLILILREKQLGVSSSLRYVGSLITHKPSYFRYNKKRDLWQVQFSFGIILAAIVLLSLGISDQVKIDPSTFYGAQSTQIYSSANWVLFLIGGFAIGFGSRYANGCTAGHCIMGNALLAKNSLISTLAFFIGGLIISHFVLPNITLL